SSTTSTANYVRQSRLQVFVPNNADWSNIRVFYPGWGQNSGGEFNSPDTQNLKSFIEHSGSNYLADFYGASNADVAAAGGQWGSFSGLNLVGGDSFFILARSVGA